MWLIAVEAQETHALTNSGEGLSAESHGGLLRAHCSYLYMKDRERVRTGRVAGRGSLLCRVELRVDGDTL